MTIVAKILSRLGYLTVAVAGLGFVAGCEKGPAEKAGASVDRGVDKVKDAVTGAGPVEKAGRAVDRATGR